MAVKKLTLDPQVLRREIGTGWPSLLPLPILWIACWLCVAYPPVHRLFCDQHAGNPGHVLESGVAVLEKRTGVPWKLFQVERDLEYWEMVGTLTRLSAQSVDTTAALPHLRRSELDHFEVLLFPDPGMADIIAVPQRVATDGKLDEQKLVADINAVSHLTTRYPLTRSSAGNIEAFERLLRLFIRAYAEEFPTLRPDSLLTESRLRATSHMATLGRQHRTLLLVLAVVLGFVEALFFAEWCLEGCLAIRFARERYRQYGRFVAGVPAPSLGRCLLSRHFSSYVLKYEREVGDAHRRLLREEQTAIRRARDLERYAASLTSFEESVDAFRALLSAETPPEVLSAFERADDAERSLEDRRKAFEQARRALAETQRPAIDSLPVVTPEESLLQRLAVVPPQSMTAAQRAQVEACLAKYGRTRRSSTRQYWLEQALRAAEGEETQEESGAEERTPVVDPKPANGLSTVETVESLRERLGIEPLVPKDVDAEYVAAILLHGLLKPLQRGRAAFKGKKGRYRRPELIREDAGSKIGWRRFDQERYATALDWLIDEGVVVRKRKEKRVDTNLGLNPRPETATEAGRPVVERVIALYKYVQRELQH